MEQEKIPNPEKNTFKLVSAEEFIRVRDQLELGLSAFLTPHSESGYLTKETQLFLSEDLQSGFGINPGGELITANY